MSNLISLKLYPDIEVKETIRQSIVVYPTVFTKGFTLKAGTSHSCWITDEKGGVIEEVQIENGINHIAINAIKKGICILVFDNGQKMRLVKQ